MTAPPAPWSECERSAGHARYRCLLAVPRGRRRYAYLTLFTDGTVHAEGASGYIVRCETMADALARLSGEVAL